MCRIVFLDSATGKWQASQAWMQQVVANLNAFSSGKSINIVY